MSHGPSSLDVDGPAVRSLWLITGGDVTTFLESQRPAPAICEYIRNAQPPVINGLLIETLRYWHLKNADTSES